MATPELTDVLAHGEDVLHRNLDDETILVDLRTGTYFGLNAVGSHVWSHLDGGTPLETVLAGILREFEVDRGVAQADLLRIVGELVDRGLVMATADDVASA